MKFYSIKILILLFGAFCCSFRSSEISQFPFTNSSLLWKIEGSSIKKGSYLFGTMHLIQKEYFIFPDQLSKLISKSDQLVMEIAGLPNQAESIKMVTLKEGSLFDYFTKEQNDTIVQWAKNEMKMNEESFKAAFSKMKPFILISLASQLQFIGKTESYEQKFQTLAKENKIDIKGFETVEQQMSFFDNLSKKELAELVMSGIRNPNKSFIQTKKLQEMYHRQNIDSLYISFQDENDLFATMQSDFLDKRNQNWVPQIKEMLKDKKSFIAVGAGHLGGPNGIIRLLQKEGYTLTPIKIN
jgi:uncharacterized protein YbaP (TraB family)